MITVTGSAHVLPQVSGHKALGIGGRLGINLLLFLRGEGLVVYVDLHTLDHLEIVCHLAGPFLDHRGRQGHVRISRALS